MLWLKYAWVGIVAIIVAVVANEYIRSTMVRGSKIFVDNFDRVQKLEESGSMGASKDKNWWVNSGGILLIGNGVAKTLQGEIDKSSKWYRLYRLTNSGDTDSGLHPQNLFRLVTRSKWKNYVQEVKVKINNINSSSSKNRNQSNGVFMFNRYIDGNNIYYSGIRVDGQAVIKKKINGTYTTLGVKKIWEGNDKDNLLPVNKWMGLRTEVKNKDVNQVEIILWLDRNNDGNWEKVLDILDKKKGLLDKVIMTEGYAGLRSDFMDAEFREYMIEEIGN